MQDKALTIKKLIAPVIVLILMLIGALTFPNANKLAVQTIYGSTMNGNGSRVYFDKGAGFDISNSKFAPEADRGSTVNLKIDVDKFSSIAVAPTDIDEVCTLMAINITVNDKDKQEISADMIDQYFAPENAAGMYDAESESYIFVPNGENAYLTMNPDAYKSLVTPVLTLDNTNALRKRIALSFIIALIFSLIMLNFEKLERFFDEAFDVKNGYFVPVAIIAFLIGGITVFAIALLGDGVGIHPDEIDVVECLKYGMTHIIPPDIRAEGVQGTFSGYGYTKLANGTYYFLIAGKIALISKFFYAAGNWFRIPNLLLFIAMGVLYIKNIKKKNYLLLILGTSVQAFYIFSYTTADALDFFFSFLVILLLTDEDSMLYRLMKDGVSKKNAVKALLIGVLFGMVMIGKQNYWAILLLSFAVLLNKLISATKEEKQKYIKVFAAILLIFAVTVGTRYAFDFIHYGFNGSQIKAEYDAKYADYDKNPMTPKEDLCATYHMKEQGYSLSALFEEYPDWFKHTYHSFCGLLTDNETPETYFILMGILYTFVVAVLVGLNYKKDVPKDRKIMATVCIAIMALSFAVSILNSYVSDAQAQGRYLLPMTMVLGYLGYITPEAFEKRYFKVALLMINVLCIWYFATSSMKIFGISTW